SLPTILPMSDHNEHQRRSPPQVLGHVAARHEPSFHAILNDRHKFLREGRQFPFLRATGRQSVFGDSVGRPATATADQEKREAAVKTFAVGFAGGKFWLLRPRPGL